PVIYDEDFPPREQVARELTELAKRRVQMLYVFTGAVEDYCNYRRQFEDNFRDVPFDGLLRVERLATADHSYSDLTERERMFELVESWLLERRGSARAAG